MCIIVYRYSSAQCWDVNHVVMQKESGSRHFPIWLLGDSEPENWRDLLNSPLDSRHSARHNIWTPVADVIQDEVFRRSRKRVDMSEATIFVRNAVADPADKPKSSTVMWGGKVLEEIADFRTLTEEFRPRLVLSFGRFAFEFARRVSAQPPRRYQEWGAKSLGKEFRARLAHFDIEKVNFIPLLHISISRGRFIESHDYFCGEPGANYFEVVGRNLANLLLTHQDHLPVWI